LFGFWQIEINQKNNRDAVGQMICRLRLAQLDWMGFWKQPDKSN